MKSIKLDTKKEINIYRLLGRKRLLNCFDTLNEMTDNMDADDPRTKGIYDAYMVIRHAVMKDTRSGYVFEYRPEKPAVEQE